MAARAIVAEVASPETELEKAQHLLDFGYAEIASALQRSEGACRLVLVNGELGLLRFFSGSLHSVLAFETAGDRIVSISIVANPVKMSAAALTSGHAAGP